MGSRYDVVVIGAGLDGLTAAARLARAGRRVALLEGRDRPGGRLAGEEFHPGYTSPGLLPDTLAFHGPLARELKLAASGLAFVEEPPVYVASTPRDGFLLARDPRRAATGLAALGGGEAAAYARWREFLAAVAPAVRSLLAQPPPALALTGLRDLAGWARAGWDLRRLGRRPLAQLLRVVPMSVADWLGEFFAAPALAGALAAPALFGAFAGPRSPGTAANLLVAECAAGRAVAGGSAGLVRALVAACRRLGAEVRLGTPVAALRVEGDRAAGALLANGEEIAAAAVVAACDPRTALLDLAPRGWLPARVAEQLRHFRCRGTTAVARLALAGPLEIAGRPGLRPAALRLGAGSLDMLERAHDAVKYRQIPAQLALEVRVATAGDPALAPPGGETLAVFATPVPPEPAGGWTAAARAGLLATVVATLAEHVPTLQGRLLAADLLTPADLAARHDLPGGHLLHGEHALDQLFSLRPVPSLARYRTPLPGLYLAGGGSHPGGLPTGLPGWLGAAAVLSAGAGRA